MSTNQPSNVPQHVLNITSPNVGLATEFDLPLMLEGLKQSMHHLMIQQEALQHKIDDIQTHLWDKEETEEPKVATLGETIYLSGPPHNPMFATIINRPDGTHNFGPTAGSKVVAKKMAEELIAQEAPPTKRYTLTEKFSGQVSTLKYVGIFYCGIIADIIAWNVAVHYLYSHAIRRKMKKQNFEESMDKVNNILDWASGGFLKPVEDVSAALLTAPGAFRSPHDVTQHGLGEGTWAHGRQVTNLPTKPRYNSAGDLESFYHGIPPGYENSPSLWHAATGDTAHAITGKYQHRADGHITAPDVSNGGIVSSHEAPAQAPVSKARRAFPTPSNHQDPVPATAGARRAFPTPATHQEPPTNQAGRTPEAPPTGRPTGLVSTGRQPGPKDLTIHGIEPNPGPPKRAKSTKPKGKATHKVKRKPHKNQRENRPHNRSIPREISEERTRAAKMTHFLRNPSGDPVDPGSCATGSVFLRGFRKSTFTVASIPCTTAIVAATDLLFYISPSMFSLGAVSSYTCPITMCAATDTSTAFGANTASASNIYLDFTNNTTLLAQTGGNGAGTRGRWVGAALSIECRCPMTVNAPYMYGGLLPSNVSSAAATEISVGKQLVILNSTTVRTLPWTHEFPGMTGSVVYIPTSATEWEFSSKVCDNTTAGQVNCAIPYIGMTGCPTGTTLTLTVTSVFQVMIDSYNYAYGPTLPGSKISAEDVFNHVRRFNPCSDRIVNIGDTSGGGGRSVSTIAQACRMQSGGDVDFPRPMSYTEMEKQVLSLTSLVSKLLSTDRGIEHYDEPSVNEVDEKHAAIADNLGVTSLNSTPEAVTRQIDAFKLALLGRVAPPKDLVKMFTTRSQINGNNGSATNTDDLFTTKAIPPNPIHRPQTNVAAAQFTVRPQINGNQGSYTNTDDLAQNVPFRGPIRRHDRRTIEDFIPRSLDTRVDDELRARYERISETSPGAAESTRSFRQMDFVPGAPARPKRKRTATAARALRSSSSDDEDPAVVRKYRTPPVVVEKTRMINRKGQTKHVKHNLQKTYASAVEHAQKPGRKEPEPKVSVQPERTAPQPKPVDVVQVRIEAIRQQIDLLNAESDLRVALDKQASSGVHTMTTQSRTVIDNHLTRNVGVQLVDMVLDTRPYTKYTRDEFGSVKYAAEKFNYETNYALQPGCYIITVPSTLLNELELDALSLISVAAKLDETVDERKLRLNEELASFNVLHSRCVRKLKQLGDVTAIVMRDSLAWLPRLAWDNMYRLKQITNPFNTLPYAVSTPLRDASLFVNKDYATMDYMDPNYKPSMTQAVPTGCTSGQSCGREASLFCSNHPRRLIAHLNSFGKKIVDVDQFMATERIVYGLKPDRTKRLTLPPVRITEGPENMETPLEIDPVMWYWRKTADSMFSEAEAAPEPCIMSDTSPPIKPKSKAATRTRRPNWFLNLCRPKAFSINDLEMPLLGRDPVVHSQINGNNGSWSGTDNHKKPTEFDYTEWYPGSRSKMKKKSGYHYPNDLSRVRKNLGKQHAYAFNHPYRPVCYANTMENEEATMMTRVVVDTPTVDEEFMDEFIAFTKKRFHALMNYRVRKVKPVPWEVYLERSNASPAVKLVLDRTMKEMIKNGFDPNMKLTKEELRKWTSRGLFLKKENLCYRSPFGEKDKAGRAISAAPPEFICATGPFHMAQQDLWKTIWNEENWLCFVSGVNSKAAANVINMPWSFVEDDIGTFDSSVHEKLGYLEVWISQQFGAARTVLDLERANVKTHGTTFHGAKYWAFGGRKSGDPFTSLYNSFLNAAMHAFIIHKSYGWTIPTIKANVRMLVAGDDNVMAINASTPCDFVGMMRRLGFNSEAIYRKDIFTVEFCSCRVYEIGDDLFFGPMPGKVLSKLGFINTPPVNVSRESLIRGVALGLKTLCNYLPPIRTFVDRILELTEDSTAYLGPESKFKGMDWQMDFSRFDAHMSPTIMCSLFETYGWTPSMQSSLEVSVAQLQLDDVISHPGFLLLCDRDTSAPQAA